MLKIAIDGPAGAGKSTIARRLAADLGYLYIDTGAMYRVLTSEILRRGLSPDDGETVQCIGEEVRISLKQQEQGATLRVFVDDRDVTEEIREPKINQNVSMVASHEGVRKVMVAQQEKIAMSGDVVMDGRDIGTTVMPDAEVKVFLKASVEERARRRSLELIRRGYDVNLAELQEEIRERDFFDSTRKASPLRKAADAIEIDTTNLTVEEVVDMVKLLCQQRKENAHV